MLLNQFLLLAAVLFSIGVYGVIARRNGVAVLMSIELILNAVNINLIAFSAMNNSIAGQVFALFVIAVAAAEVGVGLAIVLVIYRSRRTIDLAAALDEQRRAVTLIHGAAAEIRAPLALRERLEDQRGQAERTRRRPRRWLSLALAGGDTLGQGTYGLFFVSLLLLAVGRFADSTGLGKAGGWFAVAAGAVAWYAATAALAHWPTALPRRAAGRGVAATG